MDSASAFADDGSDFLRHLRAAGREVGRGKRTRTRMGELALQCGVGRYPAPDDLLEVKVGTWGTAEQLSRPWDGPRLPPPSLRRLELDGVQQLVLSPAPVEVQLRAYGSRYQYYYLAAWEIPDAGGSTVTDRELDLILLWAKVEAMRELAMRNHNKPVTLRGGQGLPGMSPAANSTPAALYAHFLREFQERP